MSERGEMDLKDIRILHITNNLEHGGVQKIIYQLCLASKELLHDIRVSSSGGVYVNKLNEIGIEHTVIPDLSSKSIADIISILKILTGIVKTYHINVIHCHHRMAVFYARLIPARVKIIYNNHTNYSDKALMTHLILRNIHVIADGMLAKKNVCEFFRIPEKQVTVIYNAVDAYDGNDAEIPEISERRKKGDFIVVNSARLHPQKGMNYFIDAAQLLIQKGYRIAFFIVGDGPLREEIVNQVNSKGLEKYVFFLGFRNDIKNVIKQSDLLVLTSIYEGLPLTPMEAFSVGRAVVATDIEGTREVVEDHHNGLLAVTRSPKSIAENIESLYLDRSLLYRLNQQAYCTYQDKFSIKPFTEQYLLFYKKL